jgi:hypothetical protein
VIITIKFSKSIENAKDYLKNLENNEKQAANNKTQFSNRQQE